MVWWCEITKTLDRADAIGAHFNDEVFAIVGEALVDDTGDPHHRVNAAGGIQRIGVHLQHMAQDVFDRCFPERTGDADRFWCNLAEACFCGRSETILNIGFDGLEKKISNNQQEWNELNSSQPFEAAAHNSGP